MAAATAAPPQQPAGLGSRWVPSLPTNIMSMLNPFGGNEDSTAKENASAHNHNNNVQRPAMSVLAAEGSFGPPSPSRSASVMFAEPDSQTTSLSGSREGSIDGRRKSKKSNKPKTSFSICHPPPTSTTRQKLHRRPRSLLQLHKRCGNARPVPALEVIPSANFSVRLTRATTKVFKAKHGLCPNDLVVLRAEKYYSEEQEEGQEARDVVALICKGRKEDGVAAGKAKMCMADGSEWEAHPLMNGGYEFFTTDEHGLGMTVRWIPKRNKDGSKDKAKKFNFSTISPTSRRHPVIANLTKTSLDINDSYKMPDQAETPLATPKSKATILEEAMDEDDENPRQETRQTDDRLRDIITVTSIWVTFKEGWSPFFKYDDNRDSVLGRSVSVARSPRNDLNSPVSTPPGSPQLRPEKRNSMRSVTSNVFRRSSLLTKSNRNSVVSLDSSESETPKRSPSTQQKTGRTRADSSATVLVHRAASNRRKNNQQTAWRPDLLAKADGIREVSREGTPVQLESTDSTPATQSEETTPQPSRRESLARPLIPATQDSDKASPRIATTSTPATPASASVPVPASSPAGTPTKRPTRNVEKERTESTTTNETREEGAKKAVVNVKDGRKSGRWKRLFCISES